MGISSGHKKVVLLTRWSYGGFYFVVIILTTGESKKWSLVVTTGWSE